MDLVETVKMYIYGLYGDEFDICSHSNSSVKITGESFFIIIPESLLLNRDIRNIIAYSMIQGINVKSYRDLENKKCITGINKINDKIKKLESENKRLTDLLENHIMSNRLDNGIFISEIR